MTTKAKRVDNNQPDIVNQLRRVPGVYVQIVSDCSNLGFDIIVRYQYNPPIFMEIKSDKKAKLTASEKKAQDRYGEYWARIDCLEEALEAIGIPQNGPPIPESWK